MWATVLAMAFAMQACAQDPGVDPAPGPDPDETALGRECFAPRDGYRVVFPDDWHVNDPEGPDPCAWFNPEPFILPVATEAPDIAIRISLEQPGFNEVSDAITTGPHVKEVASSEEIEIAGRRAIRAEVVESGEVFYPEDTRQTIYAIEWEGGTLTASTTDLAEGDYAESVEVLDRMVRTLAPYESDAACSAAVLDPTVEDQPDLPEAVAAMRSDIVEAAVACDFDRLAELAQQGDSEFTYTFGGGDDPAEFWRSQEAGEQGEDPMRYLAALLNRPYEARETDGRVDYVWPAAFASDSWGAVSDDQREELQPLYSELDFNNFDQFGSYAGYRVGIDSTGDWLFFVAGD